MPDKSPRSVSKAGLKFITEQEGYRTAVYLDSVGLPTVGVGHLLTPAERKAMPVGTRITHEQVMEYLAQDLEKVETCINENVTVPIGQNAYDALASLIINIGTAGFKRSKVLKLLNASRYSEAAEAFLAWSRAGGKFVKALENRRKRERTLFLSSDRPTSLEKTGSSDPAPSGTANPPHSEAENPLVSPVLHPAQPSQPNSQEKTVSLPAATGGTAAATRMTWQLPTIGGLLVMGSELVSSLLAKGFVDKDDVSDAFRAVAYYFATNFKYVLFLGVFAILYLIVKKILSYVPVWLEYMNKADKNTHDVTFVANAAN